MAQLSLGFNLSASATGMAQGINAGVVELQKLGYAVKRTASDVSTLKNIELSQLFLSSVQAASSALLRFVDGPTKAASALVDLSRRTGVSASALQSYQFAAEQSGVSVESFAKAIQTLTLNLARAASGDKAAVAAFSRLGISVQALNGLTPSQQFEKIADAISKLPTPAQQAAASMELFGKTGRNLLSVFQEGAGYLAKMADEARSVGVVLSDQQLFSLKELDSSLTTVSKAFSGFAARVAAELAPALRTGAKQFVDFLASINDAQIQRAAKAAGDALQTFANVLQLIGSIAMPLASNSLAAIGGYLAFINRQAISNGIAGLANAFAAAAASSAGYAGAAGTATVATVGFAASVRGLLVSTGIGVLPVVLGLAAGALIEWSIAGGQSGSDVEQAIANATEQTRKFTAQTQVAIGGAQQFGEKIKEALKVPESISAREFAEGALGEARSAIVSLAKELGGLNNIPAPLIAEFDELLKYSRQIAENKPNSIDFVSAAQGAGTLTEAVKKLSDARKADADRIKEANEAARKANEDAKKRVDELRSSTLTDAEKSRLTLNQDLEAIARNIAAIEQEAGAARQRFDLAAMLAAEERLKSAQAEGKVLGDAAREQDRQRRLQARGIDVNLLKPVQTVADQMQAVRDAFNAGDIDQNQFVQGLRNLAAEGIKIRQDIAAELRRPAQQALNVADIRTTEGMAALLGYQRQDPAIEQRRAQLQKLDEIKRAVEANGVKAAEIIGG